MKRGFFIILFVISCFFSVAQTLIQGKIYDADTKEALIFANVVAKKNGVFQAGTSTDFEGNYSLILDPGIYEITVSSIGYEDKIILEVLVKSGQTNILDIEMENFGDGIICCPSYFYKIPLIQLDNTTSGSIMISEDIQKSPFRDTKDLMINTAGVSLASY